MKLLEIRPQLYWSVGDPGKDLRITSMLQNLGKLFVEYLEDVPFDNCNVIWMVFTSLDDPLVSELTVYDGKETMGIARTTGILNLRLELFSDQKELFVNLSDSIAEALRLYFKKYDMPIEEIDKALSKVREGDYFALYGIKIKPPFRRNKAEIIVREKCIFSKRIFRFDLRDGSNFYSSYTPELEIEYAQELPESERKNIDIVMEKIPYLRIGNWIDNKYLDFSYGRLKFQFCITDGSIIVL